MDKQGANSRSNDHRMSSGLTGVVEGLRSDLAQVSDHVSSLRSELESVVEASLHRVLREREVLSESSADRQHGGKNLAGIQALGPSHNGNKTAPLQCRQLRRAAPKETSNDVESAATVMIPKMASSEDLGDAESSTSKINKINLALPGGALSWNKQEAVHEVEAFSDDSDKLRDARNPSPQPLDAWAVLPVAKEEGKQREEGMVLKKKIDSDSNGTKMKRSFVSMVESPQFDSASGILVVLYSAAIGFQTDYIASQASAEFDNPTHFRVVDSCFCIAFTVEIAMRLIAFRAQFFYMSGWAWNVFDCVLVGTQLFEEVLALLTMGSLGFNLSFMRVLRILRLVRIIRIMRILRLIGELRTIVASILGSMRSLAWTVLLLFTMIYVVAVCLTQIVADYRFGNSDREDNEDFQALNHYCGSLGWSILSLYQSILGGVDWENLASPLVREISPLAGLLFAFYIAFAVLAIMNVVTGVFVESAMKNAKEDRDKFMINHVKTLFSMADKDASGVIDWETFESQLDNPQMLEFFHSIEVDTSEARGIFHLLDVDDSGTIELDEFISGCIGLHGPAKAIDLATLMYDIRSLHKLVAQESSQMESRMEILARAVNVGEADKASLRSSFGEESKMQNLRNNKKLFEKVPSDRSPQHLQADRGSLTFGEPRCAETTPRSSQGLQPIRDTVKSNSNDLIRETSVESNL